MKGVQAKTGAATSADVEKIVALRDQYRMPFKDIAERIGKNAGTVRALYRDAVAIRKLSEKPE